MAGLVCGGGEAGEEGAVELGLEQLVEELLGVVELEGDWELEERRCST